MSRWTPEDVADYQARRGLKMEILSAAPKPNKYHAKRTEVDGIIFHSRREATRFQDLKVRERFGLISDLRRQIKFPLVVNGVLIGTYTADFVYLEDGQTTVEDSKGYRTRDYKLRRKLMLACHGIRIRET